MQFIAKTPPFFYMMWKFLLYLFTVITFFTIPENNTFFIEILYLWILTFFLSISIASRYGCFTREKMILFKTHLLDFEFSLRDSFLYFYDK